MKEIRAYQKKTWRVCATARVKPVVEHLQGKIFGGEKRCDRNNKCGFIMVNLQATRSGNRIIGT